MRWRRLALMVMLAPALAPLSAQGRPLERGTAITDPGALRALDLDMRARRFGLGRMLDPVGPDVPLTNDRLFALPSMSGVRDVLDGEFDRYIAERRARSPGGSIGTAATDDIQVFDRALLTSPQTRFMLAGIVNRMDRAYVDPGSCGEIRLIYRLARGPAGAVETPDAPLRLPMTLNLVLRARPSRDVSCREIARRWRDTAALSETGPALAARLVGKDGPLALVSPAQILRIETNLQIAHSVKTADHAFRADYLLKVFDFDARAGRFREATLENQIDRDRLQPNAALAQDFHDWLLAPENLRAFDRGTLVIPGRFLATRALAPTPAGFTGSARQPAFGLVGKDATAVLPEHDVVAALKNAAARGDAFINIRSVAGFERRLNDITCSGCHQTRGIGGFHFPGVDWLVASPSNATIVPASPHFFGDQPRRRDILAAFSDGRPPDFSRGFSDRPQSRGATDIAGTEYDDGWGATCYRGGGSAAPADASFRNWSCSSGLSCQPVEAGTQFGMCFVAPR